MRRELLCVNISGDKFKFARVKGLPNKKEITDIVLKDIGNLSDSDISKIIRTTLNEVGAKSPNVVSAIPSRSIITKNIEIPSRDPKEIQEIINLQSGRYTPYSRQEIVADYIDIGVFKQNYSRGLVIIVPRKVIKRYLEILNGGGLKTERILLVPEGICRIYPHISKLKTENAPICILHLDADSTDFIISLRNKAIFIRHIPVGVQLLLSERERYQGKFIEEVKKSLESYQNENIERIPSQVVLTGAIEEIKGIAPVLDSTLCVPSKIMPYLEALPIKKDVLTFVSTVKQISFLDILSPLFIADELDINLVPEEIKLRKTFEQRGKGIIKMGTLLMAVFVLICAIFMSKIYLKSTYLAKLTREYQAMSPETESLEKSFARIQRIKSFLLDRGYSLQILDELYNVVLPEIYLSHIRFDEQEEFSIKGSAASMSYVFSLVGNMEKSEYFQNVKTRYTTKRKGDNDKDLTDFHITCVIEKD